ncbi:hypothetical protein SDRG_04231 [Saprolegnia diclina VS20]|uniref:Band 7 domain-containing protein n=1 Tax=Saprolegnia diclina (strain VS20) TaxID=1156394 RepID=T0QWY9_SAPDV|nr:hypothetical protein SDRG_04231 [Saprolegnia diclina VS20]EQC38525.1 hypothetical protein SDRG_04231 [Saprolegnia diclina VS20]|eukprot:XP_008608117.1 hypothetical protein SDRG_04231 [Saprolegnia diclina VS20]
MPIATTGLVAVIVVVCVFWLFVFLAFSLSIRVVNHAEVMILERFGRYKMTLLPGIHFIVPVIERVRPIAWRHLSRRIISGDAPSISIMSETVDMREHVIEFARQHVITKDTVMIDIDALVYFRIVDPRLAVYKAQNIPDSVELVTQATLRNIIATMTLDDTFSSRDEINTELLNRVKPDVERWGVTITRVEIFDIVPPNDIKLAMEQQIKAERERRSEVLEADGQRESCIVNSRGDAAGLVLRAEGDRASTLLKATGLAEAKMLSSKAEAQSMEAIRAAINEVGVRAVDYLTAIQYLNILRKINVNQGNLRLVLVPMDTVRGISELVKMNA